LIVCMALHLSVLGGGAIGPSRGATFGARRPPHGRCLPLPGPCRSTPIRRGPAARARRPTIARTLSGPRSRRGGGKRRWVEEGQDGPSPVFAALATLSVYPCAARAVKPAT